LDRMMDVLIAVDVNESAMKIFAAQDRSQLLGPCGFHWKTSPETFRHAMVAFFRGEETFQEETVFTALDGRKINALFAMARDIVGIVDVTERTRVQERLQRVQAEFAHAARVSMLGELAASIAHEVSQPLTAIRINSETAMRWLDRSEPSAPKVRELIQRLQKYAIRAADIVARTRKMATGQAPQRTALALQEVIEESLQFLRPELSSKGVSMSFDLCPTLPPIVGDRIQLQQVVVNLCINAMQAMAGRPRRSIFIRTTLRDSDTVRCVIEDSGPGIDPTHLPHLFDSFFTTKEAGMGLGLSICRSIIETHQGSILADNNSALGGARFSFDLPAGCAG
jgi:C4-dicarboxylate-specific signal transduction histidine kinase